MSNNYTTSIDENECIGDSLDTINNNFANLDTQISLLSTLPNTIVSFQCERNTIGVLNESMSFGDGATTGSIVMPYSGRIIAATLQINSLNGNLKVSPRVVKLGTSGTGTTYTDNDRSLSYDSPGAPTSTSIFKNYPQNRTIPFNQGDRLSWIQTVVSGTATSYQVTFYVYFTP